MLRLVFGFGLVVGRIGSEDADGCGLLFLPFWPYLLDIRLIIDLELEAIILAVVGLQHRVFEPVPATHLQDGVVLLRDRCEETALNLISGLVFDHYIHDVVYFVRLSYHLTNYCP